MRPLTARASAWLQTLPADIKVSTLRAECPEILDLIASHWPHPVELARLFERLLFDSGAESLRPPFNALLEIASLQHFVATRMRGSRPSVWDAVLGAGG